MSLGHTGQIPGQIRDIRDNNMSQFWDIWDNPPRRDVPCPEMEACPETLNTPYGSHCPLSGRQI